MKKIDQLLIRSCKSKSPQSRLHRIVKSIYGEMERVESSKVLMVLLSDIIEKNPGTFPVNLSKMFMEFLFVKRMIDALSEEDLLFVYLDVMIGIFRFTSASKLRDIGFEIPVRYLQYHDAKKLEDYIINNGGV